ncbi:hypothetical protein LTR84_007638 [Exophiala bonariae]|uniref:RecA family profile 1 domain-containing protein n=1 Tax=Exophiala bonariae TaxID=1690606 RepID=A0AAV9NMA5_9EURO|nr:hypothetical protein LTR84_007638 [Exophiala bonariae]
MSAEQYGSSLLDGVHEESLEQHDQLLADVRRLLYPRQQSVLGLEQLDDLLEGVRHLDEPPSAQYPEWTSSRAPSPEHAINDEGASYEDNAANIETERPAIAKTKTKPVIIELTSQHSASGKTSILYYLAGLATLPYESSGKQSAVVWIDSDGRVSASRLAQVIEYHLSMARTDSTESNTQQPGGASITSPTALEALNHIHIFRPQSSTQVLNILDSLPRYLLDPTRHKSSHRQLGLLILDSATAFHAQDRFDAEMARLDLPLQQREPSGKPNPTSKASVIITRLSALQARFECTILFTTNTSTMTANTSNQAATPNDPSRVAINDSPIISPWTRFATLTLQVERVRVAQFAPYMDLEQCLHDAERRLEVVRRGRFTVEVLGQRRDSSRGKARGTGNVTLSVTEAGVRIES